MHFALPLLASLVLWLVAILIGVREVPLTAVLVGSVLAFLAVFLGRIVGFLPGKHVHLGFIPVLIALGTGISVPGIPWLPKWIERSSLSVPINYVSNIPTTVKDTPYEILKKTAITTAKQVAVPSLTPPAAPQIPAATPPQLAKTHVPPARARNPANDDDDVAAIQEMHEEARRAAEQQVEGLGMPSPEEIKKLQEESNKLLNQ